MKIPSELTSGDSKTWVDAPTVDNLGNEISSDEWTLYYKIAGAKTLLLTATASGSGWSTAITAAQSATLPAGDYFWQAYATKSTERVTLGAGQIKILKNLANVSDGFDGRSQIRKDLEAVQAAMRAIIQGGAVQEYTIANRSLTKMRMGELIVLESKLKMDLVSEEKASKIADGKGSPDSLYIRFK